jgi:rhamnogalacturonyl hydrolase YesR
MHRAFLLTFLAATAALAPAQDLPAPEAILARLRLVNDRFLLNWPNPGADIVTDRARPDNIWTRATYFEGLMALHRVAPDARYVDYAVRWGESHRWGLAYGSTTDRNADNQCCGQTYLDLYALDPKPERIRDIKTAIDAMVNSSKRDDWWWIDALQMAMPLFARFGVLTGDPRYFTAMHELYAHTRSVQGGKGLYNSVEHLWWRDADFDPPYTEPNGAHCYWSRGNGWVFAALVRVLEVLPADESHRAEYLRTFQDMAAALVPLQRPDGFWNVSLKDPDHYGGRELSGTAFFTYGMAWGITKGHLPRATYLPVVARAWHALSNHAVRPDGTLAYVQGTGKQPSDSQPVNYDSAPNFDDFGTGAFLLAGSAVCDLFTSLGLQRISLMKTWTVSQSAPNIPHPGPPGGLEARLDGAVPASALGAPAVRVVPPGGAAEITLTAANAWSATNFGLPNGTYTVVVGARTLSNIQLGESGLGGGYPAIPPLAMSPSWGRNDAGQTITISSLNSLPPDSALVGSRGRLLVSGPDFRAEREFTPTQGGGPVALTIPPFSLTPGKTYQVQVDVDHLTHRQTVDLGSLGSSVLVEAGLRTTASSTLEITQPSHSRERLVNVSARGTASAEQPLIAGFTVSPGGPKMVLIRAVGPALQAYGVSGALTNPFLHVFNANRTRSWRNDDWQSTPQYLAHDSTGATTLLASYANPRDAALAAREAGAFPLPARSRDAALVLVLPPGGYTAQVSPTGTATAGTALLEVYELTTTSLPPRLTNLSARGVVARDGDPLILGFVVHGGTKTVLLRGLGPALAAFGVSATQLLTDPRLTLFRADGTTVAENDQWESAANLPAQTQLRQRVGGFPLASSGKDAELAVTLTAGAYTVQVSSADGGAGVAVIEVYTEAPGS